MTIPSSPDGTCPFKRDGDHDCIGGWLGGNNATAICNWVGEYAIKERSRCSRYYHEAALYDRLPKEFCCKHMENIFHECAESSGYMAGGFDLLKQVNDRQMVWRNYERVMFTFCPFCGARLMGE